MRSVPCPKTALLLPSTTTTTNTHAPPLSSFDHQINQNRNEIPKKKKKRDHPSNCVCLCVCVCAGVVFVCARPPIHLWPCTTTRKLNRKKNSCFPCLQQNTVSGTAMKNRKIHLKKKNLKS